MLDPRIRLYAEILSRHEFSSWTPMKEPTLVMKRKLEKLIEAVPNIHDVPVIKRNIIKCFKCAQGTNGHECAATPCISCRQYHDDTECCCRFTCETCDVSLRKKFIDNFCSRASESQLQNLTCFKCRHVGHICESEFW